MKTAHGLVLGALLSTMAACATPATGDGTASASDQALAATPAAAVHGTEMMISFPARKELADALAPGQDVEGFLEVSVAGVLRIQHQYSIAALQLEAPSWTLVTDLPVSDFPWSIKSTLGVAFPRQLGATDSADHVASEAAAQKLFEAMTRATETTAEPFHGLHQTIRTSANKSFSCTKTTEDGRPDAKFQCTIAGVAQVGGSGLFWGER